MALITTRETPGQDVTVAGVRLTNSQVDNNFIAINDEVREFKANTFTKAETVDNSIAISIALG